MKKVFLTVGFLGAIAVAIYAAKESPQKNISQPTTLENSEALASRAPTAVTENQQAIVDEMTKIILSISDRSEVVTKAQQVISIASQKDPKSQMPGVQLLAGYMKMLPGLEGIIYRCRPIVEPSDFLHMQSLFWLRSFRYNSYLYGKHVLAIFDFVTTPSRNAGPEFKTITDLQSYLVGRAAPLLESLVAQAKSMDNLQAENFNFKLDRTLFVGIDDNIRFLDSTETVKKFIKPYAYSVIFALQRTLGSIYYWSALNVDDLPSVTSDILAKTTINEMRGKLRNILDFNTLAKGVTPIMTFKVIDNYPNYFTFRKLSYQNATGEKVTIDPQTLLNKAFRNGFEASAYELAAFNCIIQQTVAGNSNVLKDVCVSGDNTDYSSAHANNGQDFMFNPNQLLIDYRIKKAALVQRYNLFYNTRTNANSSDEDFDGGKYVVISSEVTTKKLSLNIKALFDAKNSPRNFFPKAFVKDQPAYKTKDGLLGWNYDYGFPTSYKSGDYTFGGLFSSEQVNDTKSLSAAMTTLVYTKSISPFAVFLPVPSPIVVPIPLSDTMTFN